MPLLGLSQSIPTQTHGSTPGPTVVRDSTHSRPCVPVVAIDLGTAASNLLLERFVIGFTMGAVKADRA
jgi:hypothetical protein